MDFKLEDEFMEWVDDPVFTWKGLIIGLTYGVLIVGVIVGLMYRVAQWVFSA